MYGPPILTVTIHHEQDRPKERLHDAWRRCEQREGVPIYLDTVRVKDNVITAKFYPVADCTQTLDEVLEELCG